MKIIVNPLNTVIVINVAINGCKRPFVTNIPLIIPNNTPNTNATIIAIATGVPLAIKLAQIAVVSANTEPTDKSIPPVNITQVIPNAISPFIEDCLSKDKKFFTVLNSGLIILITATKRINAITAPKSCIRFITFLFSI